MWRLMTGLGLYIVAVTCVRVSPALIAGTLPPGLYISSSDVFRADSDGTPRGAFTREPLTAGQLAATETHLYYLDGSLTASIYRVGNAGVGRELVVSSAADAPELGGLAVSDSYLYWTSNYNIWRAGFDGADPTSLVTGLVFARSLAVTEDHLYWTDHNGVGRAELTGANAATLISMPSGHNAGNTSVQVNDTHVYWGHTDNQTIYRALLDGSDVTPFIADVSSLVGSNVEFEVTDSFIYWIAHVYDIGRANLDGSDVEEEFMTGYPIQGPSFMTSVPDMPVLLGDVNTDSDVNGLDVEPFVGLVTAGTFQAEADMNRDGEVNGLDVDPFVTAVVDGSQPIPEPSTLLLCIVALGVVGGLRSRWG